jgi:adenylate cyclase
MALGGRISGFLRWLVRTPWPVFSLSMVQADVIGALLVLGFLRYGLPPRDRIELQDLPPANLALFGLALVVLFGAGFSLSLRLLMPVFRWQRRDGLLADTDPASTELARSRALRMPFYRTLISLGYWCVGGVVFIMASWPVARHAAPVVAVATALGATATAIIGYLQAERVLRPVAVAALRAGLPENVSTADRLRQHRAGGHVDRGPAAPAALGARGGATRKLQRAHADLRRQRTRPAAGRLQRHGARPVRAAAAARPVRPLRR